MNNINTHIANWVLNLIKPKEKLNGLPICPYAKAAEYNIVETTLDNIDPPPWEFDLYIFVINHDVTILQLAERCKELAHQYPGMVFLPDHKDRNTFINGEQTNNGSLNLILCQWADDLHNARKKLANTAYYNIWDVDYLNEILGS